MYTELASRRIVMHTFLLVRIEMNRPCWNRVRRFGCPDGYRCRLGQELTSSHSIRGGVFQQVSGRLTFSGLPFRYMMQCHDASDQSSA